MKRVTILALHLGYGGIERAITDLANSLIDDYKVNIVSTYKIYDKPVNRLNNKVKVEYLTELKPNAKEFKMSIKKLKFIKAFKEGLKSIKILRLKKKLMINYIKNCDSDVIISTRDIHNKWLGLYGKETSLKIGWEHNHHHGNQKYANKIIKSVENLDYFVLVSKELTEYYKTRVKCKCVYIPNLVEKSKKISNLKSNDLVSIGRLSKEKGFLDLIDVFALVNKKYPNSKLNIIGDGDELEKIQNKIKKYGLEDKIILHGFLQKDNVQEILSKCSIYVMTSLTESFGIVLLEAFSCGLPCVAFDSAEGARELITNNWDGYLIGNRDNNSMAKRICSLINSFERRKIMGENGLEKAEKYSLEEVRDKWIKIIK
ncbi:MAG: glycosyltransferase [Bacilli bacterium]|nr:glycosyltransferase [Bacilli bacterium]